MKKLLSVLIVGFFTSLGAFASADTVDGFTSDSNICVKSFDSSSLDLGYDVPVSCDYEANWDNTVYYMCISTDDIPFYMWSPYSSSFLNVNSNNYCFPIHFEDNSIYFSSDDSDIDYKNVSGKYYLSSSPITYSSSSGGDDDSSALIPGISGDFGGGISNGVNAMLTGFGNVLPDILLYSLSIVIIFLFWRHIYVFIKAVFTGRSRSSIRDEMLINDWYDNWSKSEKGKMLIAQEKVFQKELNTPGMQDKYFYTETIDKRGHLFNRYDQISDTKEILGKDLKWHKS